MYQLDNLHMKLVAKTCQEAILSDHRIPVRLTAQLPMPLNCGAASTCVDHAPRQAGASAVTAARGLYPFCAPQIIIDSLSGTYAGTTCWFQSRSSLKYEASRFVPYPD